MGTMQQAKYFQVIEYFFFFVLCGLSVYFMHGVLDKFSQERLVFRNPKSQLRNFQPLLFVSQSLIQG